VIGNSWKGLTTEQKRNFVQKSPGIVTGKKFLGEKWMRETGEKFVKVVNFRHGVTIFF